MQGSNVKYYFRGTTLGYAGNTHSMDTPMTSNSRNPVKAVVFAQCYKPFGGQGVIYITEAAKLTALAMKINHFYELEEAVGFVIQPRDFYQLSVGYVTLDDAIVILSEMGLRIYPPYNNIDQCLEFADPITELQIEEFVERAKKVIKNT